MIRRMLALILVVVLSAALPATAQINDESVKEGNIEKLEMERPLIEYTLLGCFLLAALGIGFKASKRSAD